MPRFIYRTWSVSQRNVSGLYKTRQMSPFKVGLARGLCSSESGEESLDPTQRLLKAMLSPTPKTGRKWISEVSEKGFELQNAFSKFKVGTYGVLQ